MARLRALGSRVREISAPVRALPIGVEDGRRDADARRWYNLARWKAKPQGLRWQCLLRDLFTCQMCGHIESDTSLLVADHRQPHRGDPELFWDPDNLQCLCKRCHDGEKQRAERHGFTDGGCLTSAPMARPKWFRPSCVPLTIVCGPPGAGKSTYVRRNARPGEVVICFEQITKRLLGVERLHAAAGDKRIGDVLRLRNEMLGDLMRPGAASRFSGAWLILTEPSAEHRAWWDATVKPERIVVLATSEAECLRRINSDAASGDVRADHVSSVVRDWWRSFEMRAGEEVVR